MQVKPAPKKSGYMCVGVIIGAHGILGAVKVKPFVGDLEFLASATKIAAENDTEYSLKSAKAVGQNKYAFMFKEVSTCNDAEALKGIHLYLPIDDIEEDELPPEVILDFSVHNAANKAIGTVLNIFHNGAHDVLEIQLHNGKEVLIPHTEEYAQKHGNIIVLSQDAEAFLTL